MRSCILRGGLFLAFLPWSTSNLWAQPAEESPPECVPGCRDGYMCIQSQCVSKCNPACSRTQVCRNNGQCELAPGYSANLASPDITPVVSMDERSGLYISAQAGAGGLIGQSNYEGTGEPEDGTETYSGGGLLLEGAIGGGFGPGWVAGLSVQGLLGPGSYEDEYVNTRVRGVSGGSDFGGSLYTFTGLLFLQRYFGNFYFRIGVGGGAIFVISDVQSEGTGGAAWGGRFGADFSFGPSLSLGFSVGAQGVVWPYSDDEYEGLLWSVQPSLAMTLTTF